MSSTAAVDSPMAKTAAGGSRRNTIWIIGLAVLFVVVFCGGFVYFYMRQQAQRNAAPAQAASGKPLPQAQLIDESNQVLPDSELRRGKLILVFVTTECDACMRESDFLRTVVGKHNNMRFYGVVSFGDKDTSLREGKEKFPFKLFYDQQHLLAGGLGVVRVPIKLFVEDGVIKKSWGGATVADDAKESFAKWLEEQP
ncbi:MAG TPA: hypothetical protein VFM63_03575 [Pyrinomonadaceae bacterium]|nr:hypothetical protein [Pyrinomonadaceae bacterium]